MGKISSNQCDLSLIPGHLLVQIVNNLSDECLLRFLFTCKSAEIFIKGSFHKIRKRPVFHKKLFLEQKPTIATIVDKSSLPPPILLEMEAEMNKRRWFLNPYPTFSNPLFFQWMMALNHQLYRVQDWAPRKLDYDSCSFELNGKKYRFNGAQLTRLPSLEVQIADFFDGKEAGLDVLKFSPFYPAHLALIDREASLLFLKSTTVSAQKFSTCEVGTADPGVSQALQAVNIGKTDFY